MTSEIFACLVRIKVRGHLVMSIVKFMHLTAVHFGAYLILRVRECFVQYHLL